MALAVLSGCATFRKSPDSGLKENEQPATTGQVAELRTQIAQLQGKVDQLEGQLSAVNAKVDTRRAANGTPAPVEKTPAPKASAVYPPPTQEGGSPVTASTSVADPESGFVNDDAVELYRKSLLLLHSQKYSEAVLSFASFLEQYPDHPLAGSAQFHIGEAYFREKEYKLALQEFRRVLTSYDRSPHVSDSLRMMITAEEALNMPQEAARHRQQLLSLFPQSPAAAEPSSASPAGQPSPSATPAAPAGSTSPSSIDPIPTGHSALDEPPPTAPVAGASGISDSHGNVK